VSGDGEEDGAREGSHHSASDGVVTAHGEGARDASDLRLRAMGAGLTDVGRQRRHNEDHILVRPDLGLFVVADGMGGHNAGNVASALATTSLTNYFEATRFGERLPHEVEPSERSLSYEARRLLSGIRKANRDVVEISSSMPQHHGMGSTIVGIHFERVAGGGLMHVAHVGDSRCYRLRRGELEQLTRDHSLVNDALALKPDLSEAELARLPKNIITRALGMKDPVAVDMRAYEVELDDVYLLCSDGLSGMVTDEQIAEVFEITSDLREVCELLIAMANEAGGNDNISVVLARVEADPEPARAHDGERARGAGSEPPKRPSDAAPRPASAPPAAPSHRGPADEVAHDETLDALPPGMRERLEAGDEVELGAPDEPADETSAAEAATEASADEPEEDPCPSCGEPVPWEFNFCGHCGVRVREQD
jgi:serine/threonine protein phosphatase PrpC